LSNVGDFSRTWEAIVGVVVEKK